MYYLVILLMFTLRMTNALVAFDCQSGNVNMTSISLVELPECMMNKPNITQEDIPIAVTQTAQFADLSYIRCHVEEFHHVWRCGKTIDTGYGAGLYSNVPRISRETCERMIKELIFTTSKNGDRFDIYLDPSGRQSFSYTSKGSIDSSGSCEPGNSFSRNNKVYDRPVQNTRLEIRFSTGKARLSYEDDNVIFPSGVSCKYSESSCSHPDHGYIYWTKITPECSHDSRAKALVFTGVGKLITDYQTSPPVKYIHVSHEGYDFQIQLSDQTDFVCGYRSHLTEHPRLFVTLLSRNGPAFPLTKKVQPVDVNLLNYVNSKIVFSMRHTKQEVDRLFQLFELDRCQTQNRITRTMLSLASHNPIEFAYLYFQRPGYTAVTRGEVVHVAKCAEVAVEPDTDTDGCFNELPVRWNNKTMFMSPKTKILLKFGTIVSCLPDLAPRFLIDGIWVSRTRHGLLRVDKPIIMTHTNIFYSFSELRSLGQGGLYSTETIQKYQEILTSPIVENVVSSRVHNAIEGKSELPEGYSFTSGMKQSDYHIIQEHVDSFLERIFSRLNRLGQITSTIIGFLIIVKTIIYILSCILNFRIMYESFGLITALCSFWWEALCNAMLHKHNKNQQRKSELGDMQCDQFLNDGV